LTQDLVFVLAASFEITIDADFAASYDFGCHSFLLRGCDSINRGAEIAASEARNFARCMIAHSSTLWPIPLGRWAGRPLDVRHERAPQFVNQRGQVLDNIRPLSETPNAPGRNRVHP
jgi:hypothetical protein